MLVCTVIIVTMLVLVTVERVVSFVQRHELNIQCSMRISRSTALPGNDSPQRAQWHYARFPVVACSITSDRLTDICKHLYIFLAELSCILLQSTLHVCLLVQQPW
jgi:hypothetical protein